MGSEKKWIYLSYIGATLLVSWVLNKILGLAFDYLSWPNRLVLGVISRTAIISVAVSIAAALAYFRQAKVNVFAMEVLQELKKVTWPDRKTASLSTVVVVVLVFVASIILWFYDSMCSLLIGKLLGL